MVDGRLGPEQAVDLPVGEDGRRRLQPDLRAPGRPHGRGPDRRRPADARQPPLAGRPGARVTSTSCSSTATSSPSRSRPRPTTWRRRSARRRPRRDRRRTIRDRGRRRVAALAPRPGALRRGGALQRRAVHRGRGRPRSRTTSSRGGASSSSAATRSPPTTTTACSTPTARGCCPRRSGRPSATPSKKEASFGFDPLGFRHPIVADFAGEPDPVQAGLTGSKTWQFHKLKLPEGLAAQGGPGLRQRRPGRDRGGPASRHGDPGGHLGRRRLDDLAAAPELSAGHGADRPPGGGGPARRAERPGRPAARPGAARLGGRGRRHGARPRRPQPSPRSSRRPAGSAGSTSRTPTSRGPTRSRSARRWRWRPPSPPTPTRPRATRPSSTAPAWPTRSPAGTSPT